MRQMKKSASAFKQRRMLEDRVAEKISTWLERIDVDDEDPREFVDVVDRERMSGLIRQGAWR